MIFIFVFLLAQRIRLEFFSRVRNVSHCKSFGIPSHGRSNCNLSQGCGLFIFPGNDAL